MKKIYTKTIFWAFLLGFTFYVIGGWGATYILCKLYGIKVLGYAYGVFYPCQGFNDFRLPTPYLTFWFMLAVLLPFGMMLLLRKKYHQHKEVKFLYALLAGTLFQHLVFAVFCLLEMILYKMGAELNINLANAYTAGNSIWLFSLCCTQTVFVLPAIVGTLALYLLIKAEGSFKKCYPALWGVLCGLPVQLLYMCYWHCYIGARG